MNTNFTAVIDLPSVQELYHAAIHDDITVAVDINNIVWVNGIGPHPHLQDQ
jgi:hypothetical protein